MYCTRTRVRGVPGSALSFVLVSGVRPTIRRTLLSLQDLFYIVRVSYVESGRASDCNGVGVNGGARAYANALCMYICPLL